VERLEVRGFVERRPDEGDRRINRVFLTRKGSQILERGWKIGLTLDARVMRGIPTARQNLLAEMLLGMKTNLIALDTVPGSKAQAPA